MASSAFFSSKCQIRGDIGVPLQGIVSCGFCRPGGLVSSLAAELHRPWAWVGGADEIYHSSAWLRVFPSPSCFGSRARKIMSAESENMFIGFFLSVKSRLISSLLALSWGRAGQCQRIKKRHRTLPGHVWKNGGLGSGRTSFVPQGQTMDRKNIQIQSFPRPVPSGRNVFAMPAGCLCTMCRSVPVACGLSTLDA